MSPRLSALRMVLGGDFSGSVMRVAGGSFVAQAVILAASPLITRLYSPSDLGALATFTAISAILITSACGRYELAVLLPRRDSDAVSLVILSLVIAAFASALSLVGALFSYRAGWGESTLGAWVFLIPVTVLAGAASAVFVAFATRSGRFSLIGQKEASRAALGTASQIGMGIVGFAPGGLILGGFVGVAGSNVRLGLETLRSVRGSVPSFRDLRDVAAEYYRFPMATLPAGLLNAAFLNVPPLFIGAFYGVAAVGFWAIANRILALPATVLGSAVGQVYYRRAVEVAEDNAGALRLFDRTVLALVSVSLVPFSILAIAAPWIFSVIFGPDWVTAGQMAQIMLPWLWIRFVMAGIAPTALAHKKNHLQLLATASQFVLLLGAILVAVVVPLSVLEFLVAVSIAISLAQLIVLWRYRVLVSRRG